MHSQSSLQEEIWREVYIPSVLVLLVASVMHVTVNALLTAATRRDALFRQTIERWSRALWLLQKSAFVLVQPTRNPLQSHLMPHPRARRHHRQGTTTERRGLTSARTSAASPEQPLLDSSRHAEKAVYGSTDGTAGDIEKAVCTHRGNASFFRNLEAPAGRPYLAADGGDLAGTPAATALASPIFAEVIAQSRENARRESQQLVLPFNAAFMVLSACKCFAVVLYIHYHFGDIEGGWRRLCVCGTANIMAGTTTPVLGYALAYLLPVEGSLALDTATTTTTTTTGEEAKDAAFIVQLLLQISRVELDSLPTVLVQGTAFVLLAAVLLPVFFALGLAGSAAYAWLLALVWVAWLGVRRAYYRRKSVAELSDGALPAAGTGHRNVSSKVMAFAGSLSELAKAFALKVLTLWLLLWSAQSTVLLGLGLGSHWTELTWRWYGTTLATVCKAQGRGVHPSSWPSMPLFMRVCFISLLLF